MKWVLLGVLCITSLVEAANQSKLNTIAPLRSVQIAPSLDDNFKAASFSLHVPNGVTQPAYILALVPGLNANGDGLLREERWMTFAEETNAAVVTSTFLMLPIDEAFKHYAAAHLGSGAAFERAIKRMDDMSYRLTELPILFYGYSAGGQFAFGFTAYNPGRMIGFVAIKGGYYYPKSIQGTYDVPGLIISGAKDSLSRRQAIRMLFESHRRAGAPWCWMEDAHGHELAVTTDVVIPYFRALLNQQLARGDPAPRRSKLRGFFVNISTKKKLGRRGSFDQDNRDPNVGWLPSDAAFAEWSSQDVGLDKYLQSEQKETQP